MSASLLILTAALSFLWFGVHLFSGGREVARPFRDTIALPSLVRAVAWMCWHFVSVTLLAMALLFSGALITGKPGFAQAGMLLAALFSAVGIFAPPMMGVSYTRIPQGFLFVPVALAGAFAL